MKHISQCHSCSYLWKEKVAFQVGYNYCPGLITPPIYNADHISNFAFASSSTPSSLQRHFGSLATCFNLTTTAETHRVSINWDKIMSYTQYQQDGGNPYGNGPDAEAGRAGVSFPSARVADSLRIEGNWMKKNC
jgi:hypothetical protein